MLAHDTIWRVWAPDGEALAAPGNVERKHNSRPRRKHMAMNLSSPISARLSSAKPTTPPQGPEARTLQGGRRGEPLPRWRYFIRRNLSGYLFLLPALVVFALFVWYPVVLGFLMSFQSVDLITAPTWVGWANYQEIFRDPLFGIAWRNTVQFTFYALLFGYVIPLILALVINEMRHGKAYFRLAFYFPVMLSPIVIVFLWRWIYNPDSGLLNALLNLLHLPTGLWLETPATALPSLVVVATWSGLGTTMLIYLAALQGVSATLYEAAEIDGASVWRRLWHVTLPTLRPMLLLMLVLQIINTMQVFIEPFTITSGGPQNATMSILLLIYNYAFQDADFGGASAIGVMLFVVLAIFAAIYMRMTNALMEGE